MPKETKNKALQECKACNKEISKSALKCPHCGEPSLSSKFFMSGISLIFLGLFSIPALLIIIAIFIIIIAMVFSQF